MLERKLLSTFQMESLWPCGIFPVELLGLLPLQCICCLPRWESWSGPVSVPVPPPVWAALWKERTPAETWAVIKNCALKGKTRDKRGNQKTAVQTSKFWGNCCVFLRSCFLAPERCGQNNHFVRGMFMRKEILLIESSLPYLNKQNKNGDGQGSKQVRNLQCWHTLIKLHLRAELHNDSDSFLLTKFVFSYSQIPATGNAMCDFSCYRLMCRWTQWTESSCVFCLCVFLQLVFVFGNKNLNFYKSSWCCFRLLGSVKPVCDVEECYRGACCKSCLSFAIVCCAIIYMVILTWVRGVGGKYIIPSHQHPGWTHSYYYSFSFTAPW